MKFKVQPEKPVTIEIEVDGKTSEIKFYPTDLKVQQDFFEIYEELKAYKPKEITPVVDDNGVSNIELKGTREMKRLTDFLAERVEGLNRQFRKITKNKPSFTNDDSLRKILYLASKNIVSHWSVTCRNWDLVSNQLSIMFANRESA